MTTAIQPSVQVNTPTQIQSRLLLGIAAAVVLVHVVTNSQYGFHRDELQVLSDARHMEWGFVAYPPLTPFVEHISTKWFGLSLVGLRLFSVFAQATAVVVTGMMAFELGGGALAQLSAALSVSLSALPMFEGTEFQYSSFDYLWWVLIAYFVIRLLRSEDSRWWLPIGAEVGLGLLTKYSIVFYIAGILGGMAVTNARRYFTSGWFWAAALLAALICMPNVIWQIRHDYISYHFLQHIHQRDVGEGRADGFLVNQFWICTNSAAVPLWIAGLIAFLRDRRYRLLGWMYVIPLLLFMLGKGRDYYLAAAYPMLMAMGAVVAERWVRSLSKAWRWTVEGLFFAGVAACGLYVAAIIIPFASSGPLRDFALRNNGDLREEIGWNELVKTVSDIRDDVPPQEWNNLGILVGNYGEQGAIEILGPEYRLPPPISGTNSAWLRGYPQPPPSTLIVVGLSQTYVEKNLTACRVAGHNGNILGVKNEESEGHPNIYLCGPPKLPWPEFWKTFQHFG